MEGQRCVSMEAVVPLENVNRGLPVLGANHHGLPPPDNCDHGFTPPVTNNHGISPPGTIGSELS